MVSCCSPGNAQSPLPRRAGGPQKGWRSQPHPGSAEAPAGRRLPGFYLSDREWAACRCLTASLSGTRGIIPERRAHPGTACALRSPASRPRTSVPRGCRDVAPRRCDRQELSLHVPPIVSRRFGIAVAVRVTFYELVWISFVCAGCYAL